jgi:RimJ/RimL family protein N-acetyltransferase
MEYTELMNELATAFQSSRLQYIRATSLDENVRSFVPQIVQDPVIQALSSSQMLRPKGRRDCDDTIDWAANALLGVAICLRPEEKAKDDEGKEVISDGAKASSRPSERLMDKEHGKVIGIMCINLPSTSATATHHRTGEIGINLGTAYQGKGYGREALNWMLDWGFKHAGLHTISITAASYNPRALHLYESIGFVLEGRRRETIWQNRKWYDLVEFGMTEGEWEKLRAAPASN